MENTKRCSKCGETKNLEDFYNHKNGKQGKSHHCKKCLTKYRETHREQAKEYQAKRREKLGIKSLEEKRTYYRNNKPNRKCFNQAKNRSKQKNIEFNLELSDVIVPKVCPYLKVPFIVGVKNNYQYTHSIDRIDNSKGYIKGNIEVISMKANSMKNNSSKEEQIQFALEILRRNKDNDIVQSFLKKEVASN